MNKRRKIISLIVIAALVVNSFVFPPEAYAFNLFREVFKGLKRTTRFIVHLPDKSTRWMGPVLGPIASTILTKNIIKNPKLSKIFRRARKIHGTIQKVEDLKKHLSDVKTIYNDEAKKLDAKADELEQTRKNLAKDLLKHGDIDEYKDQVAAIQGLIKIHRNAAERFRNSANRMTVEDVGKMLGKEFINTALGNIRDAVLLEVTKELDKVIDPNILSKFLSSGGGLDAVLDFFVESELSKYEGQTNKGNFDMDELRERIRQSIKQQLKKDKDFFKKNWREKIDELIEKQMEELQKTSDKADKAKDKVIKDISKDEVSGGELSNKQKDIISNFEKSLGEAIDVTKSEDDKCGPGYVFRPRSGTGCVQANCDKAAEGAHLSYTGHCICGSAGSINENPEDANVACKFPNTYSACPNCTYACIHAGEKCPLDGVKFE